MITKLRFVFLCLLAFGFRYVVGQAPAIKYTTPHVYTVNIPVNQLIPTSTGVSTPGYSGNPVLLGTGFNKPTAAAIDNSGNLYEADAGSGTIFKLPKDSNTPVAIGSFPNPLGIAVDTDGNVYVSVFDVINTIYKIPADGGSPIDIPFASSPASYQAANIFVDKNENIYISTLVTPSATSPSTVLEIPVAGNAPIILATGFNALAGLTVDSNGNVYVDDDADTNPTYKIPAGGGAPVVIESGYGYADGVAVDAAGNVYVLDEENQDIEEIHFGSSTPIVIGPNFDDPYSLVIDGSGNLYVADHGDNTIKEIRPIGGYYINPALPAGLIFSTATGMISGTPATTSAPANYTVTAYNSSSNGKATLNIAVNPRISSITSFAPTTGPIGTLVTIKGKNLSDLTTLTIGNRSAIVLSDNDSTVVAMVMPGTTAGGISIMTVYGNAVSSGKFNVTSTKYPSAQQGSKLVGKGNVGGNIQQGQSVSISADGNTAIVGGIGDNSAVGAAWVYARNNGDWVQTAKLVGTGYLYSSTQGSAVALSADGNTAVVGGAGDNGTNGAAWVFVRSSGIWSQQGSKLVGTGSVGEAVQGTAVCLSADGNTAIVGGDGDNSSQGAIWIYVRKNGIWTQQGPKLVGTGGTAAAGQGYSVALSADGNTAIEGGNHNNSDVGAAWVFKVNDGAWSQQGPMLVGTGNEGRSTQGWSVALSADGSVAIVGGLADNSDQGAAWIYAQSNGTWTQQGAKLVGTGSVGPAGQGDAVSLSADGNTAIVGGGSDNSLQGAAWVYRRNGATWVQQGSKLIGTGSSGPAKMGLTVCLSADGSTVILGGPEDLPGGGYENWLGAAWVFSISSNANLSSFKPSKGTISPGFGAATSYTATVANTVTSITITPTAADPTATITVNGVAVASGSTSDAVALNIGANVITTVVTAQDTVTKKTYTLTVTRLPGTNANLSGLTLSQGTLSPAFAGTTAGYTAAVANAITSLTVTPTTSDPDATVKVNGTTVASGSPSGAVALSVGANTISVAVTASNGTTLKTYTLTVTRALSTNANLSAFKPSKGTISPGFGAATSYTTTVANAVTSITIAPTAADANATIKVNGVAVASGSTSASIALAVGANAINTVVTAQDGVTKKTYTLTVTRLPGTNANLSALTLSQGTLSPAFVSTTASYTATVANNITSLTITPTVSDPDATLKVNGTTVASGSPSGAVALSVGANTISVAVTASNGTTIKTYKVVVSRMGSSNANLSSFKPSKGTLSPGFGAATSYTSSVGNTVTSITITPTAADANATIKVNGVAVASGSASGAIALKVGSNIINTVVTAQDGVTKKTYTLTITRAAGAADEFDAGISVAKPTETPSVNDDIVAVHQGISPNGDGINDFLVIDGIQAYPDNKLSIMNRSGQLVYQTSGYDNSSKVFDGHSNKNGQMQLPGTYFYQLDYTVKGITKHKTGFIVLKY